MNTALVPVFYPAALSWLGGCTILSRCLDKLDDVRGIDRTILIPSAGLVDQVRDMVDKNKYGILYTEPAAPLIRVVQRVRESAPADLYLVVNPLFPFLDRGNIEQILYLDDDEQSGITVHGEFCVGPTGLVGYSVQQGGNFVEACFSTRKEPLSLPVIGAHLGVLGNKLRTIPLSDVEAINTGTNDGLRIAEALVASGLA